MASLWIVNASKNIRLAKITGASADDASLTTKNAKSTKAATWPFVFFVLFVVRIVRVERDFQGVQPLLAQPGRRPALRLQAGVQAEAPR